MDRRQPDFYLQITCEMLCLCLAPACPWWARGVSHMPALDGVPGVSTVTDFR